MEKAIKHKLNMSKRKSQVAKTARNSSTIRPFLRFSSKGKQNFRKKPPNIAFLHEPKLFLIFTEYYALKNFSAFFLQHSRNTPNIGNLKFHNCNNIIPFCSV